MDEHYGTIRYEVDGAVAWVVLDRPDVHHAFNSQMVAELADVWTRIRHDDAVRCVVLTATGDKAFCTGLDRSEIPAGDDPVGAGDHPDGFDPFRWDDPGQRIGP